jgi:crotonobetainyl-CoA:carnitine CoA-transferase CaiB-like acyl-CoA transferase
MSDFLPLAGIRICDFTIVWAGQSATMYLADLGAECIKVESPYIWNPMTRAASPRLSAQTAAILPAWVGGHPGGDPGERPWNNSPAFIHVMRNKKSFTVDSRRPEGQAIVRALLRISDVTAENLPLGTLEKIGLTDEAIRAERPDIIILHVPAFGRTGAYVEGRGYGAHMDAVGGSTILRGYRDTSPLTNVQVFAGDFFAGMHGAVAVLAALRHRRRTGQGQTIELAQAEASSMMFPQAALDAAWNGRVHRSIGNRSIEGFVPNGVFPTAGGNDEWIAISCRSDAEWRALVAFMGNPGWATADALATAAGRAAVEDMIEERLAEFTATRSRADLFRELQEVGVTAGPVMNAKDAVEDPHLAQSGIWRRLPATADYPETEFANPPYRFSKSNVTLRTPPCLFGEHNDYVYRDVLGLSDEEVAKLTAEGHIATTYAPEVIQRAGL